MKCHAACTPVELWDGGKACNYSEAWRHECEARWIMNLPINKQNEVVATIAAKRGAESVNRLETTVRLMREQRRASGLSSFRSAPTTASTRANTGPRERAAPSRSASSGAQLF